MSNVLDPANEPFDKAGLARHIELALSVDEPRGALQEIGYRLVRRIFDPQLIDVENIPSRPCLFIGNHSLFALDGMVLLPVLWAEHRRFLRGLGDRFLWHPTTEQVLLEAGGVLGHPAVCGALMEAGKDLLVFPGGAHEATKTAQQKYSLQWKDRYGFVRMAVKHGYTIMPFAIVGPDEFYGHLIEGEELPDTLLGRWLRRAGLLPENFRADLLPPIPVGALGSLVPKPQRCYIQFGEPVDLSEQAGRKLGKKALQGIRDEVADQIEAMITQLLLLREQQRGRDGLLRRLLTL
jgi:1-acyl-sn-glycerol-3-phosphate acyltransferase